MEKDFFVRRVFLAISIFAVFVFIMSLIVYFVTENYGVKETCTCNIPLYFIILAISSLGIFVGTLTYYILTKSFMEEKRIIKSDVLDTLKFLDNGERSIMEGLINSGGKMSQTSLTEKTGLGRVKAFRKISALEKKGIIRKEKFGMTNNIMLEDQYMRLFIQEFE